MRYDSRVAGGRCVERAQNRRGSSEEARKSGGETRRSSEDNRGVEGTKGRRDYRIGGRMERQVAYIPGSVRVDVDSNRVIER